MSIERGVSRLWIRSVGGSDPRPIGTPRDALKTPVWSPDGQQIIWWSNRESGRKQIWIMNADGSQQRNLSRNDYNDWDPVWFR